jgi:hypothetical protein
MAKLRQDDDPRHTFKIFFAVNGSGFAAASPEFGFISLKR